MPPSSHVLLLTLGSFNQLPEGVSRYEQEEGLPARLSGPVAEQLMDGRRQAYAWLKGAKRTRWKGVPVPSLKYNLSLVHGRDLDGEDSRALFLPALRRFQGRFFAQLDLDGKRRLYRSLHHVLFLCGLYGLMTPMESIQAYDCPIEAGWRNGDIWRHDKRLTQILLDYVEHYDIKRVFDFTAMSVRRNLIDWKLVRESPIEVLHVVGGMATGDDLLVPFGYLWRHEFLEASEPDLLAIKTGTKKSTPTQELWFHDKPGPHASGPRELDRDEWAERLERMQFGILRLLDKTEGNYGSRAETTGKRAARLRRERRLSGKLEVAIHDILKLRNAVRYREHKMTPHNIATMEEAWNKLLQKVESEGWDLAAFGSV